MARTTKVQELEKRISELENEILLLKGLRWRAPEGGTFYYISPREGIIEACDLRCTDDNFYYEYGNYFRTKEEAEEEFEKMGTRAKLKDLALELNKGQEIDWDNNRQSKWYIYYSISDESIYTDYTVHIKTLNQVYCLNKEFKKIAFERIGKEKLLKLFN